MSRTIKIILANLFLVLLVLVAAELVFGAWFGTAYDPRLRLLCDVKFSFDVSSLYAAKKPAVYRRDAWCLRGAFADLGEVALVTVGGSATDQRFLGEGDTWQDRLAAHLAATGRPLAIANAGVDGQSTIGHVVALEGWLTRIPRLRPHFVLFYVGLNDVVAELQAKYDAAVPAGFWRRLDLYVKARSAVRRLVSTLVGMARARMGHLGHVQAAIDEAHVRWAPIGDLAFLRPLYAERVAAYASRLETLERLVRASGARAVFVTQARADRRLSAGGEMLGLVGADGRMDRDMLALGLFNEAMLEVCRRLGAICVDLAGELALGSDDYYDLTHNTPEGAEKIGAYLAAKLADEVRAAPD